MTQAGEYAGRGSACCRRVPRPWGLVSAAPGRALLALRAPHCATGAWPSCDLAQGKTCCCFAPGDGTQASSEGISARARRAPACPFRLERLKRVFPNHLAGAPCRPRGRKVPKSTFRQPVCPSSICLRPGRAAARLSPRQARRRSWWLLLQGLGDHQKVRERSQLLSLGSLL